MAALFMPKGEKTTPQIEELRRQCAGINKQVQALTTTKTIGGMLAAEQLTGFVSLQQQFTDISVEIERLEAAERVAVFVAKPVKGTQRALGISARARPKQYTGAGTIRLVISITATQGNVQGAAKFVAEELNGRAVLMTINIASTSGGILIPQNPHSEVIELLRDRTIAHELDARSTPLLNGNMALLRLAGGTIASYIGEGKDAKTSEACFNDVKLTAKTMIVMVPISNQLIGRAGYNVKQLILQDILTAISVHGDKAFTCDDGTGDTSVGMKTRATEWSRLPPWEAAAEINLRTTGTYLDSTILMAVDRNSNIISYDWGISNHIYMKPSGLRDGNGNEVYPEMAQGVLKGFQTQCTSAVPANLGDIGEESEVYFTGFNDAVIGEDGNMRVSFSQEAFYQDGDGNLALVFSRNQSLTRVVTERDIGFRHPKGPVLETKMLF